MLVKMALDTHALGEFFRTEAGKRTAIGAAIGATAGAISKDDNRTLGAMRGAGLGAATGFIGHHTGATDAIKKKLSDFHSTMRTKFTQATQ